MDGEYSKPLQVRTVSKDEFKAYSGYDLDAMLGTGADSFVIRTERRFSSFIKARLFKNMDMFYPTLNDNQKDCYKHALMEQMIYIIQNGDISSDAGYDMTTMKAIGENVKVQKAIALNAINELMNAGIWSTKIQGSTGNYINPLDFFGGVIDHD